MGPVSAEIEIDVSRERAFEAIADLALRPAFTDHFLTDFHLTRIEPTGVGAGARFRVALAPRRVWMDTSIVELQAPHKVVERGRGGRANRIPTHTVWELVGGSGSLTRVRVGPVLARAEADQLKQQVKSKLGIDGIVRPHP